jgi:hypothetical protein
MGPFWDSDGISEVLADEPASRAPIEAPGEVAIRGAAPLWPGSPVGSGLFDCTALWRARLRCLWVREARGKAQRALTQLSKRSLAPLIVAPKGLSDGGGV